MSHYWYFLTAARSEYDSSLVILRRLNDKSALGNEACPVIIWLFFDIRTSDV